MSTHIRMNILYRNSILLEQVVNAGKRTRDLLLKKCHSNPAKIHLKDIVNAWTVKFEKSNIPEADMSAQLIASHVLRVPDMEKLHEFHEQELDDDEVTEFNRCGECRLVRIPLQYIIREWDFRDTKLKMLPPVFIPRPETEQLIDIVAENSKDLRNGLEIGCGSGAISIALLKKFPGLRMEAIDQSRVACKLTLENARFNGLSADRLHVCNKKIEEDGTICDYLIESPLDFIVSNPPYLFTAELYQLEPEVKLYEDLRALDGGRDGLRVIKAILTFSSKVLAPSKKCFLEVHHHHSFMLRKWLDENQHLDLKYCQDFKDYFGNDRFVCVVKQ